MTRGLRAKRLVLVLMASLLLPLPAFAAQSPQQVVEDLNHGAMEAYNSMDINKAGSMLEEALRVAAEGGVTGPLLAHTNLNLAIVYVGGLSDNDGGVKYFMDALCADPSVQLDPLTSTPDIQNVFQVAQQKVQQSGCANKGSPNVSPGAAASSMPMGAALTHNSPAEQLAQTPLPLYADVNPSAHAQSVYLYYKGMGMAQWKRVAMFSYQRGVAYQLSCNDVWEPKVQYYIEAVGSSGRVVGSAGSAAQPIEVPVVATRTQPEAALPGAPPPASCASSECPPGVKGCGGAGRAAIGEQCSEDTECQSGLKCDDSVCMLRGAGGTELASEEGGGSASAASDAELPPGWGASSGESRDSNPKDFKRGFFQLGLAAGMTYVQAGMLADRNPPDNLVFVDKTTGRYVQDPLGKAVPATRFLFAGSRKDGSNILPDPATETAWVPDQDSSDSEGQVAGECPQDNVATGPDPTGKMGLFPSRYCVRVKKPGFVPGLALRGAFGYFVSQRLSLALITRFQFAAGVGTFSHMLLGGRIEYLLTRPRGTGFMLSGFLGGTFGQIQAQPPTTGNAAIAPWIKSGLQGGNVGLALRYRIVKNFGFFMAPELDLQFPTFLWNIDLTFAGMEAAF